MATQDYGAKMNVDAARRKQAIEDEREPLAPRAIYGHDLGPLLNMSMDSGLANPIPDNGLAEAPDFLLEPEATLVDVDGEMARGTQHADWVEVAWASKVYLG